MERIVSLPIMMNSGMLAIGLISENIYNLLTRLYWLIEFRKIKGLDVAKEIISLNPHQRIIIASYYGKEVFDEAAESFGLPLEILQKPFFGNDLLDMINDMTLYDKLKKRLIDIEPMKKAKFRHEQLKLISDLLEEQDKKKKENTDVR
jgi:hypothetical protein